MINAENNRNVDRYGTVRRFGELWNGAYGFKSLFIQLGIPGCFRQAYGFRNDAAVGLHMEAHNRFPGTLAALCRFRIHKPPLEQPPEPDKITRHTDVADAASRSDSYSRSPSGAVTGRIADRAAVRLCSRSALTFSTH